MANAYRERLENALNDALRSCSFVLITKAITNANRHAPAIRAEALRDALDWLDEEENAGPRTDDLGADAYREVSESHDQAPA